MWDCECYKIGGKFIAEDPDCPVHGTEAQWRADEQDRLHTELEDRISRLEALVKMQALQLEMLANGYQHVDRI